LEELSRKDPRRVRIAILDTGIDMNHVDMLSEKDRIKKVYSWVDGKNGEEDRFGGDISGHGTHIASIVLDIAPNADLYIARITKTRLLNEGQTNQIAQVHSSFNLFLLATNRYHYTGN
jgi:subtilisin family serine protease